ncbi:hypothetical protein [Legionella longbeachae]|uniref:Uncharacterized protein n=1 Tax=Legionella longbeachae serogroup 1 (strain NSW150) TaxID=661367 RepID=D3HJ16_LEGLN|nr:hypothetical protein [Legionella longbeachae]VEE02905.1 Uncharacterised protein [Legionella oakridgensis]HBD7398892.1 hypothetical protein [Legionella pneumophila]ARB90854.1 hypothetical protein A6J40_00995 [Legionella longbeachae]ARM32720.1 hypothetical protein B0B39_03950 [Legionella longbeachae]EEZ94496.1 conserved hypothetical protein [Legionella longbeachae D-4968]
MSDFKSKLPDLKELASMTSKLYTDIKKSVGEIVQSYKENRSQQEGESEQVKTPPTKEEAKTESKPVQEETPKPEEKAVETPIKDDSQK